MTEDPELLNYLGRPLGAAGPGGQAWLCADELGRAMGLASPEDGVARVHHANADQFSARLAALLPVETPEGPRPMLAFDLLGAYVLATFVLTPETRQLHRWLLETLVYQRIDDRRELRRLGGRTAALEGRVDARRPRRSRCAWPCGKPPPRPGRRAAWASGGLVEVPFRGATLFVVDRDGEPYVPMKPVVEGMGFRLGEPVCEAQK